MMASWYRDAFGNICLYRYTNKGKLVFFVVSQHQLLNKESIAWWFKTLGCTCDVCIMISIAFNPKYLGSCVSNCQFMVHLRIIFFHRVGKCRYPILSYPILSHPIPSHHITSYHIIIYHIRNTQKTNCHDNQGYFDTLQLIQPDMPCFVISLQWRHNERDFVQNNRRLDCLFNCFARRRSKKTSKLCITSLCDENPPLTSGLSLQRASNTENGFIWWRHHVFSLYSWLLYTCLLNMFNPPAYGLTSPSSIDVTTF